MQVNRIINHQQALGSFMEISFAWHRGKSSNNAGELITVEMALNSLKAVKLYCQCYQTSYTRKLRRRADVLTESIVKQQATLRCVNTNTTKESL